MKRGVLFFNIVGMNSLAIYIFTQTGATDWLSHLARPFTNALFGWAGELGAAMATSVAAWAMLWGICFWLYRRRILIKI